MKLLATITLIAMVLTLGTAAQIANSESKHFQKAGLAFDFPAEWTLTDKSTDEVPYFALASTGNTTQISVIDQKASVSPCDQTADKTISDSLLARIATQIHAAAPLQTTPVEIPSEYAEIKGVQLHGLLNSKPVTAEVYSLAGRFVNLVYLRLDDDQPGQASWERIRTTIKVAPTTIAGVKAAKYPDQPSATVGLRAPISGGVLNGKAIHLAQPPYPSQAKAERASGTVVVKVIIDEYGNVISANTVSGHFLLQPASIAAARESKFSPTRLCGQAVRVTGIIQYNFVAR